MTNKDCPEVVGSLSKAWKIWEQLLLILGRGGGTYIGTLLPGHSAGNPYFWIGDVGGDLLHRYDPVGVPPPGYTADNGGKITVISLWDLTVPPF